MPENSRIIVGVAGRIGSGKTAVARHFEQLFGFQYLRYSQILAEWFKEDPENKRRLQEVGGAVMADERQGELNRRLIDRIGPTQDAVIDGLRHPVDVESLRAEFGRSFFLVFVETPEALRFGRLRHRFDTFAGFHDADSRPVESHIDSLRAVAATVLPGTMAPDELSASLHRLIQDFRQRMVA